MVKPPQSLCSICNEMGEKFEIYFVNRPSATATQENPDYADYQNKNKDYERVIF